MRRALLIGLAVALSATACGDDEGSLMGPARCSQEVILVAQSVPGASFVPCFESLPGGWTTNTVSIGHDGSKVSLDSDRAGTSAATFTYRDACDVAGVGRLPSDQEGVRIHEEIERLVGGLRSTRSYVFDGGCVTVRFDFDEFDDISHAEDLLDLMQLIRRTDINDSLRSEDEIFEV